MFPLIHSLSRLRTGSILVASVFLLAACGPASSDPEPTKSTESAATAVSDDLTVGDILGSSQAAWEAASTERVTTQWGYDLRDATPAASPAAANQESIAIRVSPDSQYFVNNLGGVMMEEVIVVDDIVYARGPRMNKVIAPHADPETWVKVDPGTLPEDEPIRYFLLNRVKPTQAPFSNLRQDDLARPAKDIGVIQINGRTCHAYTYTEDNGDMGEWEIEVSFDDTTDLPCRLVRTMEGGYQAVSIFEYDVPGLALARPDTFIPASPIGPATPVVGPLGLPSTGPLSTPVPATPVATPGV